MNKSELLSAYTAEQLAEMVINLQIANEVKNDEIRKLKWQMSNLEESNGRLQSKLDTYNNYLLRKSTKEAKEMIDHNHFTGVRIVTWEQWNNRGKADGKVCFPKEYEQTVREFLNTDTSEIEDDCHRFGIECLQRYLKNPAPIKIPKRDDKNMNISDIQKCQEEYEKLLKENPLEGVMDKICKDILEQKNNAMAMEFTRIICDLLKRYGVYVHCTETKFGEKITTSSIEEQYGIVFDSMDFSQHDKEFTDKIKELEEELEKCNREHARTLWEFCDSVKKEDYEKEVRRLQSEVEKYRKAFEYAKKERDCQIAEYRKKIEELESRDIAELLPTDPIKVADMLINVMHEPCASVLSFEKPYSLYDVPELKQIAEHLLVYCNHNGEAEE